MHIHISAICGTFMGGIARLARELGHRVTGSDANIYPPMSDQLQHAGIELMEGYSAENLRDDPDFVIVGNALSRGNPEIEALLNKGLPYTSGPQWLAENILHKRWVLAVAGTHGKTTCSSLLAWILQEAGLNPGYLIGGVPKDFEQSACLGQSPFFVVEADEYDTAFFDKRSKFVHYRPRTLILNNLEFDHADIFDDLDAIKTQFHHLVRTVPASGLLVVNSSDMHLDDTLKKGCWTSIEKFDVMNNGETSTDFDPGKDGSRRQSNLWLGVAEDLDLGSGFQCIPPQGDSRAVTWNLTGRHNVLNAMGVIAAARHAGVPVDVSIEALSRFSGIKRRMEVRSVEGGVKLYDDFAHHPTAIHSTLRGLRARAGDEKIIAVLEMRSNTMRMGYHKEKVLESLKVADLAIIYTPEEGGESELNTYLSRNNTHCVELIPTIDGIVHRLRSEVSDGDHIVVMSNGSFDGLLDKVTSLLREL